MDRGHEGAIHSWLFFFLSLSLPRKVSFLFALLTGSHENHSATAASASRTRCATNSTRGVTFLRLSCGAPRQGKGGECQKRGMVWG